MVEKALQTLRVRIQTPDEEHFDEQASVVTLKTNDGMIQVMPGHVALVGSITASLVVIDTGSHQAKYFVRNGMVTVEPGGMQVLISVFSCTKDSEVDLATLKEYRDKVAAILKSGEGLSKLQVTFLTNEHIALEQTLAEDNKNS
ncbi:MAG: F0F1 ATP synthase subunit epsilon [Patescibacteria group bacterium]